jgi:hypothetical protein
MHMSETAISRHMLIPHWNQRHGMAAAYMLPVFATHLAATTREW